MYYGTDLHPPCTLNFLQHPPLHVAPYVSPNLDPSIAGLSDPAEATTLFQDQLEVQSSTQ